jgi:hypothetical protein
VVFTAAVSPRQEGYHVSGLVHTRLFRMSDRAACKRTSGSKDFRFVRPQPGAATRLATMADDDVRTRRFLHAAPPRNATPIEPEEEWGPVKFLPVVVFGIPLAATFRPLFGGR